MNADDQAAIIATIERTVNGKIDKLTDIILDHNEKHERDMTEVRAHIEQTKPVIEAYNTGKNAASFAKWLGGIVIIVAAAWALVFKQ